MDKLEEMWAALAAYQPQADAAGHGPSWARMCKEKTVFATAATADADAYAYAAYAAADAAAYAYATNAAADAADAKKWSQRAIKSITKVLVKPAPPAAPVQKPEHLQQGVDALVSAAGTALEVLEKHRQIKGEAPMGMLGVRAMEELKEAFGLLYPQDDYEPPAAQPAVPDSIKKEEREHPKYMAGWNDCRQTMMEMMKARTL